MATTDFGGLSNARKRVWATKIWREGVDQMFWMSTGMMGSGTEDAGRPVHLVTELTPTERGDRCIMQLVNELVGDGVVGDNELEGNEEALSNDDNEIVIDQLRNGVKSRGRMSEQRTVIRFRAQAKQKLSTWLSQRLDECGFLVASGVPFTKKLNGAPRPAKSQFPQLAFAADVTPPTAERVQYAGTATSTSGLTANDKMTWNFIVGLCAHAQRKNIRPVRDQGREKYCIVMSPEQLRDLKTDQTYLQAVSQGHVRGTQNPLFRNASADIDGVTIFSANKVYNTQGLASGSKWGSGGDVEGAQALLFGAQGFGFARLGDPSYTESDRRDYRNKEGIGYGRIIGFKKSVYQSTNDLDANLNPTTQDFAIISAYTAAAKLGG